VQKGDWAIVNREDLGTPGGNMLRVEQVYMDTDEKYDADTKNNDLALLYLAGTISDKIPRVKLVSPPPVKTRVLVAGWGVTSEGGLQSMHQREVDVPLISNGECIRSYPSLNSKMVEDLFTYMILRRTFTRSSSASQAMAWVAGGKAFQVSIPASSDLKVGLIRR
jgi:hypothetical protein